MELKEAKKFNLNKYTHSVRAVQAVLQYGVGAMVDFPDQTLMTAAPEYWGDQIRQIHDERLEKVLKVDYFGLPIDQDDPKCTTGISYVRFPEWYFCPKCRKFQPISEWVKEYKTYAKQKRKENDPEMVKHMQCPTCRQELVVARIITACKCGHIDDFPWVKWVHAQNIYGKAKPVCDKPSLTIKTSATSSEGLEGLTVTCTACGARATLKKAFDKDVFYFIDKATGGEYDFHCTGRHPWKNIRNACVEYPSVLQRGSSSVYFPVTASSLVIPPYSSMITQKIEDSPSFSSLKDMIAGFKRTVPETFLPQLIESTINSEAQRISLETGISHTQVEAVLSRKWLSESNTNILSTNSVKYRAEEYEALSGEVTIAEEGDFTREGTNINDYLIPGVSNVSLIHKIREVQALTGFSRINPLDQTDEHAQYKVVSIKQPETNWYPAYEVRGEGIFIELDEEMIKDWIKNHPEVQSRVAIINENLKKSYTGKSSSKIITAKFLLIHTLSHLLIKQLSFECGYSIASLKERLYCSEKEEGKEMAGIFIYTASGDSEGTLGGLVRQGRPDVFPEIFKKAVESAITCSNDPVCSLSQGQGRDSLNLSACHSCCLIPETSCEEFNVFLDRGTIVGTYENRNMGFYSEYLNTNSWEVKPKVIKKTPKKVSNDKTVLYFDNDGTDLTEMSYLEIWNSLAEFSDNEHELAMLTELSTWSSELSAVEKPKQNTSFRVVGGKETYNCDLYWPNRKTALFTEDNKEGFEMANKSDYFCIYLGDEKETAERIISILKKGKC